MPVPRMSATQFIPFTVPSFINTKLQIDEHFLAPSWTFAYDQYPRCISSCRRFEKSQVTIYRTIKNRTKMYQFLRHAKYVHLNFFTCWSPLPVTYVISDIPASPKDNFRTTNIKLSSPPANRRP